MSDSKATVDNLWNSCNILRDDGPSDGWFAWRTEEDERLVDLREQLLAASASEVNSPGA